MPELRVRLRHSGAQLYCRGGEQECAPLLILAKGAKMCQFPFQIIFLLGKAITKTI
jgi:hypothetical protein